MKLPGLLLLPGLIIATPLQAGESERPRTVLHMGMARGVADNPELQHEAANYTLGLGIISGWPALSHVGLDLELWLNERRYDTPFSSGSFTRVNPRMSLTTAAVIMAGRIATEPTHGVVVALNAGPGWFMHKLRVNASTFGLPVSAESKSMALGWQLGASFELPVGGVLLSLEWRLWQSRGEFSPITDGSQNLATQYRGFGLAKRW